MQQYLTAAFLLVPIALSVRPPTACVRRNWLGTISALCAQARYYGIFWDWDGEKSYSKAELAERKGLTLCESAEYCYEKSFATLSVLRCTLVLY